jgi:hypothetical protein
MLGSSGEIEVDFLAIPLLSALGIALDWLSFSLQAIQEFIFYCLHSTLCSASGDLLFLFLVSGCL